MRTTLFLSVSAFLSATFASPTPDPGQQCTVTLGAGIGTVGPGDYGLNDNGDFYFIPVGCEPVLSPCGGDCEQQYCRDPPKATDVTCIPGSTYIQLGDVRFCGSDGFPRSGGSCQENPNGCVNALC